MKTFFLILFTIVPSAIVVGSCSSHPHAETISSSDPKHFEIQGHRGARWMRPENTMSAFRYAVEIGVDTLEMDIHATKDNVLVITHDPVLNPEICLDPSGHKITKKILVRSLSLKELQKYDCGTLTHPRFPDQVSQPHEKIPTFEELLTWLEKSPLPHAQKVMLNVETKSEEAHPEFTPEPKVFTEMILTALKNHHLLNRSTLQSFDFRTLVYGREMMPDLTISALIEDKPKVSFVAIAEKLKANIVSPDEALITEEDVDALHRIGVRVLPWTANSKSVWQKLVGFGVDGIITDNPQALMNFRAQL